MTQNFPENSSGVRKVLSIDPRCHKVFGGVTCFCILCSGGSLLIKFTEERSNLEMKFKWEEKDNRVWSIHTRWKWKMQLQVQTLFLTKEDTCASEILQRLFKVFDEKVVSQSTVYNSVKHFRTSGRFLDNRPWTGPPSTTITTENISDVEKCLDNQWTGWEIPKLSRSTFQYSNWLQDGCHAFSGSEGQTNVNFSGVVEGVWRAWWASVTINYHWRNTASAIVVS